MSTEPISGLTYQQAGSLQTDVLQNAEVNYFSAWTQCAVLTVGGNTPPASPANGDRHIVGTAPTGAWADHANKLAVFRSDWQFYAPRAGSRAHITGGAVHEFSGTAWAALSGGGISDAPSDGTTYGRNNGAWVAVAGGGAAWTNVINQPFSANTTGFQSNGTGTWAISGGVLLQSTAGANGAVFYATTKVPHVKMRLRARVKLLSAGAGAEQVAGFYLGTNAPAAVPNGNLNLAMRNVSGTRRYVADKYGTSSLHTIDFAWGALDVFHDLEIISTGSKHVVRINGSIVDSYGVTDAQALGYQYVGLFTFGTAAEFSNFTADTQE